MVGFLTLVLSMSLLAVGQSSFIVTSSTLANTIAGHMLGFHSRSGCRLLGTRNRLKLLSYLSAIRKPHHYSSRTSEIASLTKESIPQQYEDARFFTRFMKRAPILNKGIRNYACDTTRLTLQTIIEYIKTGTICGFQVAGVRFGLGK